MEFTMEIIGTPWLGPEKIRHLPIQNMGFDHASSMGAVLDS